MPAEEVEPLEKLGRFLKVKLGITNLEELNSDLGHRLAEEQTKRAELEAKVEALKQLIEKIRYVEDPEFQALYRGLKREGVL